MPRWVWVVVVIIVVWMLIDPNSLADFVEHAWGSVLAFMKGVAD